MKNQLLKRRIILREEFQKQLDKLEQIEKEEKRELKEKEKKLIKKSLMYKVFNRKDYIKKLKQIKNEIKDINPHEIDEKEYRKIKKRIKEISHLISTIDKELDKLEQRRRGI